MPVAAEKVKVGTVSSTRFRSGWWSALHCVCWVAWARVFNENHNCNICSILQAKWWPWAYQIIRTILCFCAKCQIHLCSSGLLSLVGRFIKLSKTLHKAICYFNAFCTTLMMVLQLHRGRSVLMFKFAKFVIL